MCLSGVDERDEGGLLDDTVAFLPVDDLKTESACCVKEDTVTLRDEALRDGDADREEDGSLRRRRALFATVNESCGKVIVMNVSTKRECIICSKLD